MASESCLLRHCPSLQRDDQPDEALTYVCMTLAFAGRQSWLAVTQAFQRYGLGRDLGRKSDPTKVSKEPTMNSPRMCPHCGTELIEPTFVYATMSVSFDGMPCQVSGLHAYRCDKAHFFLVFD